MELIQKYWTKKGRHPLPQEEINTLILKAQAGDIVARQTVIENNLGLVIKAAFRKLPSISYNGSTVIELGDCVSEAIFGLDRAIDLFRPEKGFAFSTYATFWIHQHIQRFVDNFKSVIRLPIHAIALHNSYEAFKTQFPEKDEDFYIKLIAFENNKTESQIKNSLKLRVFYSNKFHETNEDGDPLFEIEDITNKYSFNRLDSYFINQICRLLPERDKNILMLRMDGWSLRAIAEIQNITRERVRQIQVSALRKLKTMVNLTKYQSVNLPINNYTKGEPNHVRSKQTTQGKGIR